MTPSDLAAAPGGPSGPPADHWINRFARFADEVPDLRRDGETPPQAVADATPRRGPFGTWMRAAGLPEPHWVATSPGCAALLGLPDDW
ncbi:MAG TPA: hypothetical protein VF457_01885, partial [Burkholderiaceae bacterium]